MIANRLTNSIWMSIAADKRDRAEQIFILDFLCININTIIITATAGVAAAAAIGIVMYWIMFCETANWKTVTDYLLSVLLCVPVHHGN